jgi:hypothetical protein
MKIQGVAQTENYIYNIFKKIIEKLCFLFFKKYIYISIFLYIIFTIL